MEDYKVKAKFYALGWDDENDRKYVELGYVGGARETKEIDIETALSVLDSIWFTSERRRESAKKKMKRELMKH